MKKMEWINRSLCAVLLLFIKDTQAGIPLWTFTPLTATTISVPENDTATIKYRVTNQSRKLHTLVMTPISGVTQDTTTIGACPNPFILKYEESCSLILNVNGASLTGSINQGPAVCEQGNPLQCYRPSANSQLAITKTVSKYTVGGTVGGLLGTVVLLNNGSDPLTIKSDGTFAFSNPLPSGSAYSVTVQNQPLLQTCTVNNSEGIIGNTDVTDIVVTCSLNAYTVGGNLSGLAPSEQVILQNNFIDRLTLTTNGAFTFSRPVAQGAFYRVRVNTQPATQTCTVVNGTGRMGGAPVSNVQVTCAANAYTVGGTVSGLAASENLVLLNDGEILPVSANGSFTFTSPVAQGATYDVTVSIQPENQICTVTNGSGVMGGAPVTNVLVTCVTNTTTLTSNEELALSINAPLINAALTGQSRNITITNTGSSNALGLTIVLPSTWPNSTVTSTSTNCGASLAALSSCTITITPGAVATSGPDGITSCTNGIMPFPDVVTVTSTNADQVNTNVIVLGYGCIYQSGYVFAINDTTPDTESIAGTVLAQFDQAYTANPGGATGIIWSSNSHGIYDGGVSIWGIAQSSTTATPIPNQSSTQPAQQVPGQSNCNGRTDGACNTANIIAYYSPPTTNPGIDLSYYAAGLCKQQISGYSDWYLPAICEMGPDVKFGGGVIPSGCVAGTQNVVNDLTILVDTCTDSSPGTACLQGTYWTSPEYSGNTQVAAWSQFFAPGNSGQYSDYHKQTRLSVRCARAF